MWNGYFRIKKDGELTADNLTALRNMGSGQIPNYPNLRTHLRTSTGYTQAIVEGQFSSVPIEEDVSFAVTEFEVFEGNNWSERGDTICAYIIANKGDWV